MTKDNTGNVHHYNPIKITVTGVGNLKCKLLTKTNRQLILPEMAMSSTDKSITKPTNFKAERARLEIRITEINETFRINKIIIHTKPVATGYPG